jgi:hypothetical protein
MSSYPSGMSGRTMLFIVVLFGVVAYVAWRIVSGGG